MDAQFAFALSTLSPKEAALQAFEEEEGSWLERIRAAAYALWQSLDRPISTNELRKLMEDHPSLLPPPDRSMNIMGAVFKKGWRQVERTESVLDNAHHNPIWLWEPVEQ